MDFSSMSGWDFERYCADCLLKKGFTKAEVTSGSGDHGVDIIAEQNGIRFGIQCKLYQGQIPNKAVQEAYTGASYYDCDIAVIMSNSELTKQAQEEARKLRVKFWNINDYIPENDKRSDKEISINNNTIPKSYKEYVEYQQTTEKVTYKKLLNNKSDSLNSSNEGTFAVQGLYKGCTFKNASRWIQPNVFGLYSWTPIKNSINCYFEEVCRISGQTEKVSLLLGKLSYIDSLYFVISHHGDSIKDHLLTECREIRWYLKEELQNKRTISTDEFNQKYWGARYRFEQLLEFIPLIEKLGRCFTDEELSQINGEPTQQWYAKNSLVEETIQDNFKSWNRLLNWWDMLDQEAALLAAWFPPYSDDTKAQNYIETCENTLRNIEERSFHYREYEQEKIAQIEKRRQEEKRKVQEELYISRSVFVALLQNLWTEKKYAEILKEEKEKQEQLEKERCEAEKRKLERQNIERKEQERKLKEKQEVEQKERERLLKEKQEAERKALVQSLIDQYNTECSKIDSEATARRKELESRAQKEIAQAQKQIGEFLKQKEAFTLFRKKRDAELDAKIAVLDRRIEQVKQDLADELAKCEKDAEEKKSYLHTQIVNEAKEAGVQEVFLNNIM